MSAAESQEILGLDQVASLLRISKPAVYALIRERRMPQGAKVGRKRLWLKSDLIAFLQRKGGKQ